MHRNRLGHIKVKDHNGSKESAFFESSHDPTKSILHKLLKTNGNPIPMNNIPTHNTNNQLFYKNNKRVR